MLPVKPNAPPWVSAPLLHAGPAIERVLGEGFLPVASSYYPAGSDVLGRGGFGYVLQTRTPGVVMKITVDGSEAFLVEVLRKIGGSWPGLPQYVAEAMRVDLEAGNEPVWIVWRKDTPPPTLDETVNKAISQVHERYPFDLEFTEKDRTKRRELRKRKTAAERKSGDGEREDLRGLMGAGMTVASAVSSMARRGASIAESIRAIRGQVAWAQRVFDPSFESWSGWRFAKGESDLNAIEGAAVALLGYEMLLQSLATGGLVPELAQSMLRLLNAGVMICDVQADNVSAAVQPHTLYDGGFTLPIDPKWVGLWEQTDVRVARWFDHNARSRPWEAWIG